jgi:hypothetical protein
LVDDLEVGVDLRSDGDIERITVVVSGHLKPFGPVPLPLTVRSTAASVREAEAQ